ncbi:alpha/beta-hydrolase [Hyaloscypha variabilis]
MAWESTLPVPVIINGRNHIPPPSVEAFETEFAGILPEGNNLPSSWGVTRFYDFSPDAKESARRVLLIHGVGTSGIGMAPLALRLKEAGSHVVIYDLWGYGLSSTPLTAHVPAIFHIQILELLSYLKWSKAHLLGFSGDGAIAATFRSRDYPWYVKPMTIEGWCGLYWLRRRTVLGFVLGNANKPKLDWKERLQKGEVDVVAVQLWERAHHKGHEKSVISMFEGLSVDHDDKFTMLPKSGVEVLLILGEKDPAVQPDKIRKAFSNMEWHGDIHEIKGAGHDVVRPSVDETARVINQFWAKLEF